ncbi:MAG TPA: DUF2695 domain-containing protein [Pirellulales bacterium]
MTERPEKRRRKEILSDWRTRQREAAKAKLPMLADEMEEFFAYLANELAHSPCDHTSLPLTKRFCEARNIDFSAVQRWCRENNGECDCEVVEFCQRRWDELRHGIGW